MKLLNKDQNRITTFIGIFSTTLLFAFAVTCVYSPVIKTNAEEFHATSRLGLYVYSNLSMAIIPETEDTLNITPTSEGNFKSRKVTARVVTNIPSGYTISLYRSSTSDLTNVSNSSQKISSDFEGEVAIADMPVDSWGFSLDNEHYVSKTTAFNNYSDYQIRKVTDISDTDSDVYLGVKIGNTMAYGSYRATVAFTAVTEYYSSSSGTIYDIATLQDMTYSLCSNTTTPNSDATEPIWENSTDRNKIPHRKLVDIRDGKEYIIAKYADGSCWMVQNLDYNIDPVNEITRYNTNRDTSSSFFTGIFKFTNPTMTTLTDFKESDMYEDGTNTLKSAPERSYAPQGTERYYQGGTTAASTPTESTDAYAWERTGVYYNVAATLLNYPDYLSSSYSSTYYSICPRGWKLPSGSDLSYLLSTYSSNPNIAPILRAGKIIYDDNTDETKIVEGGEAGYYWTSGMTYSDSRNKNNVFKVNADGNSYNYTNANNYDGAQIKCKYYN